MTDIFKALSDETRLRILSLLWDSEKCVCEIEASLELTQSNASRHLTALKNAGILSSSKQAQWAYYRLSEEFRQSNKELSDYLAARLKALPTYEADIKKAQKCKDDNLCGRNIV